MSASAPTTLTTDWSRLTGTYTVDPAHSRLGFVARHAMITKVRGSFNEFEGRIDIDGDHPAVSRARVVIQASSVDTRNADRDGHLRSNDFFAMEQYPEIVYKTTAIEPLGDTRFRVTGDLTIKGTSRPVTIDFDYTGSATDAYGNERIGFEGSVSINRKDWGITWNAALEAGGVLVSETVTLEIEVSAIRTD